MNRETWLVSTWIDNDAAMCDATMELNNEDLSDYGYGQVLRDYITNSSPATTGLFADFIADALREVDWLKVAQELREE